MEIIKTFPWRTAILASIGYLVLSLPFQLGFFDNPSILSWVLWVAMGPVLVLNIAVVPDEDGKTFLTFMAVMGLLFHVYAYVVTFVTRITEGSISSDGETLAIVLLCFLLVGAMAWIIRITTTAIIWAIVWLWNTIVEWVSQDWE